MVVLISAGLLLVILLVIISPTAEGADFGDFYDKLGDGQDRVESSNRLGGFLSVLPDRQTCAVLLDDENAKHREWTPWSFPPVCIPPEDESGDLSTPGSSAGKLCTYTVFTLRGGPGMSLVTTPEVASSIAANLQDPDIAMLERERGIPFAPSFQPLQLPYKLRSIPGKGTGVVATAPISKGQVLMVETPILLELADLGPWNIRGIFELLQHAAVRLPKTDRGRMLNLTRAGKAYIVQDVMKTNSFQVNVGGVHHSGLYPDIARINHACSPNCFTRYSPTTLAMEVVAYTDIQPGEELSVSYLPLNLHYRERQETLLQNWGFTCSCSLCNNPAAAAGAEGSGDRDAVWAARKISDRRRARIGDILENLGKTAPGKLTVQAVQNAVAEIEDVAERERLHSQVGDLYSMIADVCVEKVLEKSEGGTAGLIELARELAKKSVRKKRYYAGVDSERTAIALEKLERLERMVVAVRS
ncbi:N-lysine methyltransferase SMYD2 [Rhypophila decipiens]|uniref:N-lysine methyltransferase SMYD2 n=1 Tax=Rhypophila decipiens TaxID=261697 RepID=A0AAN6Y3D8_9PEZI|nr:N-lysine methyltransferase SMYD2 [Rhypophila decipiens]